jgi:hypothetical protein
LWPTDSCGSLIMPLQPGTVCPCVLAVARKPVAQARVARPQEELRELLVSWVAQNRDSACIFLQVRRAANSALFPCGTSSCCYMR